MVGTSKDTVRRFELYHDQKLTENTNIEKLTKMTNREAGSSEHQTTKTTEQYEQKYTLIEDSTLGQLLVKHYRAVKREYGVPIIFTEGRNNYVLNEMLHGNMFRPDICLACYQLLYREDQQELSLRMAGRSWHQGR